METEVKEQNKYRVGEKVVVNWPYDRKSIGKITYIDDNKISLDSRGFLIHLNIDELTEDRSNVSISKLKKGDIKRILTEGKRQKLSSFKFYSLTDDQVNDIYKRMKDLGVEI